MRLTFPTACAVFTLGMAGSAFADSDVTATLASPVSGHVKFIAAHAVFNCEGVTCAASNAPGDADDAYACQDVAKRVGRIVAYSASRPLNEKALAKCNQVVATPKTAVATSR